MIQDCSGITCDMRQYHVSSQEVNSGGRALTLFLHPVALLQSHVHGDLNLKSTDQLRQDCHCFLSAGGDHGTA